MSLRVGAAAESGRSASSAAPAPSAADSPSGNGEYLLFSLSSHGRFCGARLPSSLRPGTLRGRRRRLDESGDGGGGGGSGDVAPSGTRAGRPRQSSVGDQAGAMAAAAVAEAECQRAVLGEADDSDSGEDPDESDADDEAEGGGATSEDAGGVPAGARTRWRRGGTDPFDYALVAYVQLPGSGGADSAPTATLQAYLQSLGDASTAAAGATADGQPRSAAEWAVSVAAALGGPAVARRAEAGAAAAAAEDRLVLHFFVVRVDERNRFPFLQAHSTLFCVDPK